MAAVTAGGDRIISVDAATSLLADPTSIAVIGLHDEAPVGYAIAYMVTRIDGDRMVMLYDVTVSPDHRRRGIARAMIEVVLSVARVGKASKVWTVTDRDNHAARATYEATGATGEGDDLVMAWDSS